MKNLPWMEKGKRLERILCFITLASLFAGAVMAAALIGYHHKYNLGLTKMNSSTVCLTPGCVKAASLILSSLDENVDPCDNFYHFACGGWLKTHHIPDDKSYVSVYREARDTLNLQLKTLLEKKLDGTEPRFITMAKELYDTCMDIKSIEKAGAEPLKNVLKSLGGWPVIEGGKWDERKFDWIETLISLRELGYSYNSLLYFSIGLDYTNTSRHIISLDQASLGIERSYLIRGLEDSATSAYYKKMVKAATLLGADERTAQKELLEALQLEITIANYSIPYEEMRNFSKFDNKYTVKALQEIIPQIPWFKYISGFLMSEIHAEETLNVLVPEYIKKIVDLLARTEKRVIANYMLWSVIDNSLPFLSKEWRYLNLEYFTVITGKREESPRWKKCLSNTLDIALSSYYIRHHFKDETKDEVLELVKYVFKEFLHILDEIDWMDEKTKEHAKAKANNMIFNIGYPDELLNNTAVMEHYQNLTISNDSYFENCLRLYKWSTDDEFSSLRKPNDRKDWKKNADVADVNAWCSFFDNAITILAGFLESPFFSKDRPKYLNFASMGATIGHEITHGFDDGGRQFDKDGNNVNWWEKVTDENFRKKAQCIIDQYSNYTADTGMNVNGVNTQGENIADNGGIKESYLAYQSWVKDNGPEQLLPGLKYSQNQLFWIATAALENCAKYRPQSLNNQIISDPHSPAEFRVIGPLSNLDEFVRDFNCPPDSPMNKKHKCQVW